MIDFHRIQIENKADYEKILLSVPTRGCEYSFANLYLWGRQQIAFLHGCVAFFAHYSGCSVYPYPIGTGDRRAVLELILEDAEQRGIPCRICCLSPADREELEQWFPGRFLFRTSRDSFDYVYDVNDLADLRGRKFQRKRNHVNRFRAIHPDFSVEPITGENLELAQALTQQWFKDRLERDPEGNYLLEQVALDRTFSRYKDLGMEGLLLNCGGKVVAMTMGSRLSQDTMDIHFEKALEDVDGAYAAINCEFARHLRLVHPEILFLDREDDLGLEGLRKAKLSYNPHHMLEKYWAYLGDDVDDP